MAERGTRLSESWIPTDKDIAYAESLGMSQEYIALEAEKFRDYWTSLPGQKARKLNWEATWRNWVRKDYSKVRKRQYYTNDGRAQNLEIIAQHINASFCQYGAYHPSVIRQCVDEGLVTVERAREVGL